jgi:hypothetical protein
MAMERYEGHAFDEQRLVVLLLAPTWLPLRGCSLPTELEVPRDSMPRSRADPPCRTPDPVNRRFRGCGGLRSPDLPFLTRFRVRLRQYTRGEHCIRTDG